MLVIRPCSVAEFFSAPNADALLTEYAQESSLFGLPSPQPDAERYEVLERTGMMTTLAAYLDDVLVGFLVMIVTVNPHYNARLAVTESYFVASEHRSTGAGLRLLREAEDVARAQGAVGFFVSAPNNGRLTNVMPRVGYRETNRVFFRGLA